MAVGQPQTECWQLESIPCSVCVAYNAPYELSDCGCGCDVYDEGTADEQGYCDCDFWMRLMSGSNINSVPCELLNAPAEAGAVDCKTDWGLETDEGGVNVVGTSCARYGLCNVGCHRTVQYVADPTTGTIRPVYGDWKCPPTPPGAMGSGIYKCSRVELSGEDC